MSRSIYKSALFKQAIEGIDKEPSFADLEPSFEDEPVEEDEKVGEDELDQAKYNEMIGRETPSALDSSEELVDQVHKAIGDIRKKMENGEYTSEEALKDLEGLRLVHNELSELQESISDHEEFAEILDLKKNLENIARVVHAFYEKNTQSKAAGYKSYLFKLAALDYIGILDTGSRGLVLVVPNKGEIPLLSTNNEPFTASEIQQLKPWLGAKVGVKGDKHNDGLRVNLMDIHPVRQEMIQPKVIDPRKADVPKAKPVGEDELSGLVNRIQVILSKINEKVIRGDYESVEAATKDLEGLKRLHMEISKWLEHYPDEQFKQQKEVRAVMMKLNMFIYTKFVATAGYRSDLFKQALGAV